MTYPHNIQIASAGAITPMGLGVDSLWQGLLAGRVAFSPADKIRPYVAAHCEIPARDASLNLRRCMALALESTRELASSSEPGSLRRALVLASTKGELDQWELQRAMRVTPLERGIILSEMALELAERLGVNGRVLATSTACASGSFAAIEAAEMLEDGDADEALVTGVDGLSLFIEHGFASLQALSKRGARPFDLARDGLTLGEAGASVLLRRGTGGGSGLGRLVGWGASNDANHISGPSRDGGGLLLAIERALTGIDRSSVVAICAHGTATRYNDAMEAHAFTRAFKQPPPVFSIKGNIGHTLGAAGVIELIISGLVASSGLVPATAGFERQSPDEPALDIVHMQTRQVGRGLVLSTNSGFGGMNTALLIAPGEGP